MTTLRWGLLSTAQINRRLIPAIRAAKRSQLVAVSSRDAYRAQQYAAEWNIPMHFGSYDAMLACPEIDAVYISLPNHMHAEWTIKALHAGKHVLCEKPFALTLEDVDGMISAANTSGKVLAEAFMYRFNPQTMLLRDWILTGRIGELKLVQGWFTFMMPGTENVRMVPDWGGGSLWDVGVYPISFAQYMVGSQPDWVLGTQTLGPSGVDTLFSGTIHYPGGQVTQFHSSFSLPFSTRMILFGSEGTLVIDHPFTGMDQHPRFKWLDSQGKEHSVKVPRNELYRCEVEGIESAVLDGNPPVVTLQETRNHIRTVLALIESAQTLQRVHLS